MLHPLHNGGTLNYQRAFGGKAGSTEGAATNLSKGIGLIPWWYTNPEKDPKAELVRFVQGSDRHFTILDEW